jgi:hypothetical protein
MTPSKSVDVKPGFQATVLERNECVRVDHHILELLRRDDLRVGEVETDYRILPEIMSLGHTGESAGIKCNGKSDETCIDSRWRR